MVGFIVGKRGQKEADQLLEMIKERTDDTIPLFTSDDLSHYENAILKVYGIREEVKRTGKRGRPRKPKIIPRPDLKYAKVKKKRRKGKVVEVNTEVVFGDVNKVLEAMERSPVSNQINISFVERNNLTMRERNRRLTRKTLGFSKKKDLLRASLHIYFGYYHLVKTHKGLRVRVDEERRKWMQRTPMMAAGITNHIWSVEELLTFRTPQENYDLMEVGR